MEPTQIIFVLLLVIVGIVVAVAGVIQARRANEAWTEAAEALGFEYRGGGLFRSRSIRGSLGGNRVIVDTLHRDKTTYTRYRVLYAGPLGLGLRLSKEGFFTGIGKLLGAQDIEVGDASFDSDVVVKGRDPSRMVEFLTPARRFRIQRALSSYSSLVIGDAELKHERRGVSGASHILSTVKRLAELATALSSDSEEDLPLGRAVEAQREGRIEEALDHVRQAGAGAKGASPDMAALAGEIHYLAGQKEAAAEAFARAGEEAPDDPEIRGWTSLVRNPPKEEVLSEEAALDRDAVCEELFPPGASSLDVSRIFETKYEGRTVRWRGKLRRVEGFQYDFVFGSGPAVKALLVVHEGRGGLGARKIQAVVRMPEEDRAALDARVGEEITFEGRLLKADGLVRNLYVTDGKIG